MMMPPCSKTVSAEKSLLKYATFSLIGNGDVQMVRRYSFMWSTLCYGDNS